MGPKAFCEGRPLATTLVRGPAPLLHRHVHPGGHDAVAEIQPTGDVEHECVRNVCSSDATDSITPTPWRELTVPLSRRSHPDIAESAPSGRPDAPATASAAGGRHRGGPGREAGGGCRTRS